MPHSASSEKPAAVPTPKKILNSRIRPKQASSIETLEPRVVCAVNIGAGLLSATALNSAQVNEIVGGLEDLGKLGDALEANGLLNQHIEGLDLSLGDLLNFGTADGQGGFLGNAFRNQLDSLFQAELPAGPTVAQINTWLDTSPLAGATPGYQNVTWSLVQGGEYSGAHPLEWEVTIGGHRKTQQDFVPGADATTVGIAFTTAPKVAVDASTSFTFSFGLTDTDQFFATLGSLSFNVDGAQPVAGMTGTVAYTVAGTPHPFTLATGSTVALHAGFGNVAITEPAVANGEWSRAELAGLAGTITPTDFTIGTTTDTGLQAKIRLATTGGTPVQFILDDTKVLDATAPKISHDVALVDYVAGGNVTGVFQRIQDVGTLLDTNPLRDVKLPGIGTALDSIDELPAFSDLLALKTKANDYMTTVANPTFNGLAAQLNSFLATQLTTAGITLNTLELTTEFDPATSAMLLKFAVDTGDITKTFDFDRFGAAAAQAGISFGHDENIHIDATVRAQGDFGFGLDLTKAAGNAQSVFFTSGALGATVDLGIPDLNLGVTLGPVTADIQHGNVHAGASLALHITDATDDGRYTLAEMNNGSEVTFGFTPTGTFSADLPLDIKIAGATFTSPHIKFNSSNVFTELPKLDTTTANFDKIFNLGKIGPEAILDLIIATGDWASNFRNAPIFDANIPFLNTDLGQAFDFGLLFTKNLRDKLQNNLAYVALDGDFHLFTLANAAPLVLGDGASAEPIVLPAATYATKTSLITALNTALGASSKFQAQAFGDNGVAIAAKNSNDVPNFAIAGPTYQLKAIGFVPSSTVVTSEVTLPLDAPTDGKITGDAQIVVSVDGGAPVTITLAKTATDTNTSVADLASDLDSALSSQGIDATAVGGKLKLVRADGKSFMVAGVSGTKFQQIGVEDASAAGITNAGSTLQTGLTYSTLTDMVPMLLTALGVDDGDNDPTNDPIRARYDAATETIILHFDHSFAAPTLTVPVGVNFDLSGWAGMHTVDANGNPKSTTLSFTPTIGGSFDLGISVANQSAFEELAITAPAGFAPNGYGTKPDGSPDGGNALAWDGTLAADAVFTISFDDGVAHTLTIAKSATTTNTSAADILADVQAAIAANSGLTGKLDARLIAKQGGTAERIEFFTKSQAGLFQIRDLHVETTADTMGFAADQLELSTAPSLAVANANTAAALDFSPTGDAAFTISLDGGAPVHFTATAATMSANTSMADLLADLNDAVAGTSLAGKVRAVRYGVGNQFQFIAADGSKQMSFSADSVDAQTTLKFDSQKIITRSRGGTFFIDHATLDATGTLTLDDVDIAANLGFIGLKTTGLGGTVMVDAHATLTDGTNTRFEMSELLNRVSTGTIGAIVETNFGGTASATMSGLHIDAGLLSVGANADVVLTATNIFAAGGANFAVTFNGFDPTKLTNFSHLSWQQIYEGVKQGVEFLSKTEQFNFLGSTKIPLINQSITEVFSYTDKLVAAIDELQTNPAGALAEVEARVEQLLGIPAEDFSLTLDANSVVKMHLGISTSFATTYNLDFDLTTLASYTNSAIPADLLTLGGFLDASAEGSLQFGARAALSLDLGFDFSGGGAPSVSLYPTSGVDVGVRVSGENLNLSASFGPAGFEITDGSVIFDSDGLFDDDNKNGIEDKTENDGKLLVTPVGETWVDDDLQDNDFATVHFGPKNTITDLPGTITAIAGGASVSTYFGPTIHGVMTATLPGAITSDIGSLDLPGPIVVSVPDAAKLFSSDATVRKTAVVLTLPDMSGLLPEVPGLIQLLRDPAILLDGVDSGLGLVQKALSGKTAAKLPLIGDQLRSGAGFIQEFRAGFVADLTSKLRGAGDNLLATMQQGMFDLFAADTDGAQGLALGILQDYNGDGSVTADDVVLTFRKSNGLIWVDGTDSPQLQEAVQFNLHLGQSIEFGTNLDLDWGLPGLDLDIHGSPKLTAGWDLFLGFGVSIKNFFYLDSAPPENFSGSGATLAAGAAAPHELSLHFNAVLSSDDAHVFAATGRLFFLQLDALDKKVDPDGTGPKTAAYSHIGGEFFVDLTDPGVNAAQDGQLTIKELFSRGAVKPLSAGLEAEAIVNIGLTGSVAGSAVIPRILADFHLDWNFVAGQAVAAPHVSFEHVKLDLGSFISDFLKPIVNEVNNVIKPFDPVLNALQTRIPVLSDLMGRNYTVLDLAVQFGHVDRRFIDAVLGIRSLVADIAALPDHTSILIDIGDLTNLGGAMLTKDGAKGVSTTGATPVAFGSGDPAAFKNVLNKSKTLSGGGFGFPILQPANAFKLLLGQDATLVTYDIPRLEVGMSMVQRFRIWGPLIGKFSGNITAYADFAVGFDTKGFNTYRTSGDVLDILDGFYVSDRANADGTGADVPEAGFSGRIGIAGAINAAVVEAGIEGFFELHADLDLKDPNNDGKVRGSEVVALLNYPNGYGPLNLGSIHLKGDVGARAYVDFWAPFGWYNAWEWEFARVTLFDKTFSAPDVTPTLAKSQMIGTENTVTLNAGPTANQRNFISTSDVGEAYEVSGTGKNITVKFVNTGDTQTFTNVDRIVLNGGKGNDSIKIGSGVTTAITFDGGEGDDYFEGGAGNDIIIGGTGNDTLIGGGGNNTLDGGDGADLITGGAGNDIIIGGAGDDTLDGKGGADTYRFANEWGNDVFDGTQTGTGAFDFSQVTTDLTLNIGKTGAQGSSGNSFISFDSDQPYITSVKGGSGNDVATVAATGSSIVTVDGGGGSDQYLVSFGRLDTAIHIADTGSANDSDTLTIRPLSRDYTIDVGDLYVSGTKTGLANPQRADFTSGIENLTVDAKSNGGSIVQIAEDISLPGDVRILARQATIAHTIDAGDVRVESTFAVNIAANVNAHDNGSVNVLVNGGNITISEDVMSSSGAGFTGDGAGLIHLFTAGGAILTGGTAADHGHVLASGGSLLLRGTNGSIGTLDTPIYSTVKTLAASTTGTGFVNVHESDGVTIDTIASIDGIKTAGGTFNVFNDAGELRVAAPISLGGGDGTLTSDVIQIDANVSSPGGAIFLRPEGDLTTMSIGDGVSGTFALDQSEIDHLVNGLASIRIGQPTGRNLINLGDANFVDPVLLQNPVLGGHIDQTGIVTVSDGGSFTILGSGHTTELDNQNVAGNIDIIDSAVVREGEAVTLTSSGGAININFNLDGTAGGGDETLTLNAAGAVVIKGAIGSTSQLGTLRITGATDIHFEGAVNVKHLILDAGATFTTDGAFNATDIALNGVASTTFHSGVTLTTGLTTTGSVLTTAIFEGQVTAPSVTITAKQLVDFYQLVDVTSTLNVNTTNATGDIVFRQQVDAHAGNITVQSLDDVTFIGPVAGHNFNVTSADVFALQANAILSGAFVQSAGTGIATFSQFTAASADVTAAGLILGGVTTLNGAPGLVVHVGSGAFSASNAVSAPNGPIDISGRTISFQSTVAANSATLAATESITVANSSSFTLGGALSATTTNAALGEIKFTGPVDVGTTAVFNTPRGLTFQNTLAVDGALTVQAASSAQYQGAVAVGGAFTQQAGVTGAASFSSTVQAGSLALQAGLLSFTGDITSLGAAGLTSNTGGITASGNVTVAGALTANASTSLALQGATSAHSMSLNAVNAATIGAGGLSTIGSPGTGNIQITTTGAGNSATLNGPVNAKGLLDITSRAISFQSTVAANAATLAATETITTANASSFTIAGALNATTTSGTVGEIKFTGPVDVGTNAVFNTPRALTFQNSLDVDGALTVQAASTALYQGAVTVVGAFTQQPGVTGAASFSSAVQAGSLALQAGSLTFTGDVTSLGAAGLTSNTGSITANGNVSVAGALTANASTSLALQGATSAHSMVLTAVNAATIGSGGLSTIGSPTTGNIQITTTGAGNSATLNGPVNAKGALNITSRAISFQSTVAANGATLTADETITTANASSFTIAGGLNATTTSASIGEIKFTGPVDVGAGAIFNTPRALTFQNSLDVDGALTVQAASTALYQGAVAVGGAFTQQAGVVGVATFSSTVQAGSLALQAGSLAFNGDVTSLGNAGLTSNTGGITATGNVSVAGALTTNAFTNLSLQGTTTAHSMVLNVVGTTTVGAGGLSTAASPTAGNISIVTTGAVAGNSVTFNGPVNAKGALDINAARGVLASDNIHAGSALNIVSQRGVALSAVDAGSVNIDALSINLPSAVVATGAITLKADTTGNIVAGSTIAAGGTLNIPRAKAITTSGLVTANSVAIGQGVADSIETVSVGVGGMTATNDLRIRTTVAGTGNGIVTQGPLIAGNAATVALDSVRGVDVSGSIAAGNLAVNGTTVTLRSPINVSNGVTLNSAGALSVDRDLIVAGNVAVTQAGALTFGAVLQAANLSIANTASATFTGAVGIANNATIAVTGNLTSASTINVGGALSIPSAAVITLNSAVTAGSASIAGGTLVTGGDVTTTTGALAITTSGDVTIAGKTTVAQSLGIIGSDDVTLSGSVTARDFALNATSFLAGGAFTTNVGSATFTTTGNIRVVGLASIVQDLTVNSALNTTFQGQVAVTGALTQTNGSGTTRFEGVTNAAGINVRTAQQIFSGSTFRANGGDIRLEADEIDFTGGTNAVQGTGNLTLRPYQAGTSIDVGSPTPTGVLDLSDSDLNALQDGFAQIIIGRAEDATGAMLIGSSSFKDNVAFHAGSIVVENNPLVGQVVTTLESLELTARTGSITTNDDLFGTDAVLTARDNITINNKVEVADFITLIAGTDGSGAVTLNGALKTTAANGAISVTTGLNGGDLTITGTLASTTAGLVIPSGAILQTSGRTTANDLVAFAKNGITLRTTSDHISARVTGAGGINISDTNASDTHVLNLGSQTDVNDGIFTANGDITVLADQSVNAYRVVANGAVSIESGGEVYVDHVIGAPVHVTGTILIDTDRTTNGEQIRFDGNIRLLRDITLTSNGGNIIITGRVNGSAGQHYGLTVNAGGGDVTIGGPIGNTTPVSFLQINDADAFSLNGGARTEGDLEINADSIAIVAPVGSISTTGGGQLRLLPNTAAATIDIGSPTGGVSEFSLNDAELASLGNGFGLIQIGQRGGMHNVTLESARLLDDVEINGDNVTLLQSSVIQGVNGLSVVNGTDDNDIAINAQTSFTQGTRAALAAGRNGNIAITADSIALDAKSRGIVRGFGELLLQPLTPSREITLGGAGPGFELTADEFGALGNTFSKVTIGRADGAHAVNITSSLNFRDTTEIRTPLDGGSVTIGSSLAPITVQTVGRGDSLRIASGGDITIDGSVKTVGRGTLDLLADLDANGDGDLLIGQHLSKRNKSVNISSEFGAIHLQGENIAIGARVAGQRDAGFVSIASVGGDIGFRTNLDADVDGGLDWQHARNSVKTAGLVEIASANHGGAADLIGGIISGRLGVNVHGFDTVSTTATQVKSSRLIAIEAMSETFKAGSVFTSLAEIQILGNAATGVLSVEKGATISATKSILLDAADVQRARGSIVTAKTVTIHEI